VALPTVRWFAALLAGAIIVLALGVVAAQGSSARGRAPALGRAVAGAAGTQARMARLASVVPAYHGGPTVSSTGETVDVRVSDALTAEAATPEQWAEFLTHLEHGPELAQLTVYIVTFDEMQAVCSDRALGCYVADTLVAPGETAFDTTPEEIIRHEYGHHIALHRLNPPWVAIDWGPKRWASAMNVCARVSRNELYPGNESTQYRLNPGEAWAETYRILQERMAGITTGSWQIVDSSLFPNAAALQAAEQDVIHPWTGPTTRTFTRVYAKKTARVVWWIPLSTPLDGDYRLSATVPARGSADVALVSSNRGSVLRRAQWVGQRSKQAQGTICGQRSLFVRVVEKGLLGRVRVSVTTP
jgi:hypothetical protein